MGELLSQVGSSLQSSAWSCNIHKYPLNICQHKPESILLSRMSTLLFQPTKADLAIADLTVTTVRNNAIDFTMPFMKLGQYLFVCSELD